MSQDKKNTVNENERSILAAQESSLSVPNSVLGLNPTNNIVASATNIQPYSMISKIIMINRIVDNKGAVTGSFLNGATTDDDTPELQGVVTTALNPDEMIVIFRDGVPVGVATLNLTSWSFTDVGLESGKTYVYTAQIQDINGNTSNMSSSFSIVTQFSGGSSVNQLVTIDNIVDDVDPVQGIIAVNGNTNDTTPTLNGKLSEALLAGESIVIYRNGVEVGTAVVTGTDWTYTSAPLATDGSYVYKAAVRNATGVDTQVSNEYKIILDTAPVVIQSVEITSIIDDANPVTGAVLNGGFTNDKTPLLKGRINPAVLSGDTVLIYRDGDYKGTAQLSGSDWEFTDTLVTDGTYNYTAVIKNQAGVEGPASSNYTIVLDTVVPSVLVLDSVMDAVGPVTGPILSGGITDDTRPVLNGHGAEPGATIVLKDKDGNVLNEVTADATGAWSVRPDPFKALVDGLHTLQIVQVDKAGNESVPIKFDLTVDTVVIPDPTGTVTVDSFSGADTTPTIKGSYSVDLLTGEFIQVKVNGVTYKQGDGHLSVNTTTHKWVLTIPNQNALNVDGQTDVTYDVVAQKVNSLGKVVNDQSLNELTVYRDVTLNTGLTPNNMPKQPLFTGTAKLNVGSGEQLEVVISNPVGQVVRIFNSANGTNGVSGLQLDTVNNTWSINNSNWGSNQLVQGSYYVRTSVIPADRSTGGQTIVKHITVVSPTVIIVPNKSDNSDINSKVVALSDGGYVLVWAQNQNEKIHSMYSKYDVVMQRYDHLGNSVGTLKNLTNTNIKPLIFARESEGYADRGDMWNNGGSLNVMLNSDGTLAVNYNSFIGQWMFKDNYDLNGNRISHTTVKGESVNPLGIGDFNFGLNEVQTSYGKLTVFTSGTIHKFNIMTSSATGAIQKLTDEHDGGNGYIYKQIGYMPLGGIVPSESHASNSESVSAISLGGNKYLVQYADFYTVGSIKNLTTEKLAVYEYNGATSTFKTSITANNFDNGWQLGAKSISLKGGGFVSLWLSNHSGASSISDKGSMDDFDVYARRFNYDANTNSLYAIDASEKRVNTTTNGVNGMGYDTLTTGGFSGAALENGGYVVVWVKMTSQSAGEVYSQVYDAVGNQVRGETLVSTYAVDGSGSVNLLPSVAGLKNGGYVVSWSNVNTTDYAVNSFTSDIKMAIFNADGSLRGGTGTPTMGRAFIENSDTITSQDEVMDSAEYLTGPGIITATKNGVTTLDGRQGATDLIGGSANDYFIIKDTNFDSILGGEGTDTLLWDSISNLRLADLLSKIEDIEIVNLGDQHANTVEVTLNDVLNFSSTTDRLIVQGGGSDQVVLEQDQWSATSTQNYQGESYTVYTHNDNLTASLWVQNHLGVIG